MPARFANIDHDTPLLLPPELRDWIAPDHIVHFIKEAIGFLRFMLHGLEKAGLLDI